MTSINLPFFLVIQKHKSYSFVPSFFCACSDILCFLTKTTHLPCVCLSTLPLASVHASLNGLPFSFSCPSLSFGSRLGLQLAHPVNFSFKLQQNYPWYYFEAIHKEIIFLIILRSLRRNLHFPWIIWKLRLAPQIFIIIFGDLHKNTTQETLKTK